MTAAVVILGLLALAGLLFVVTLLTDGMRARLQRRRAEARRQPLELVVADRREAAGQLLALTLTRPGGGRLPRFAPGQHLLLQAPAGRGGRIAQRAYSLAAWTPKPRAYELAIKRESRGLVSSWAWETLHPGSRLRVVGPCGDFVLAANAAELVLIAGGIGITPMRAMLHAALGRARRIVLFHAARTPAELLYRDEFEALAAREPRFAYLPIVSRPGAQWGGASGRLDADRIVGRLHSRDDAQFYLCASAGFMDALCAGLALAGIRESRIHREAFGAGAVVAESGNAVRLEDGAEFTTAGEPTLLLALEANGQAPPSECRAGTCGLCRMRVLEGEVRWLVTPSVALSPGELLPCVCVTAGDVRLSRAPLGSPDGMQA